MPLWADGTRSSTFLLRDGLREMTGTMNATGYGLFFDNRDDGDADVMQRLVCHALVAFMPRVELEQTVETLSEYYAFHTAPRSQVPEVQVRMLEGAVATPASDWSVVR